MGYARVSFLINKINLKSIFQSSNDFLTIKCPDTNWTVSADFPTAPEPSRTTLNSLIFISNVECFNTHLNAANCRNTKIAYITIIQNICIKP